MENLLLKKENDILKRKLFLSKERIVLRKSEKLFFVFLNLIGNVKDKVSLFTPASLLKWQRNLIAHFWTFFNSDSHPGRKPVPKEIRELILSIKNDNLLWGVKRIRDELIKINIDLHKSTIRNILIEYRKKGKIRKSFTWRKFLSAQLESLFAMDYFTVDTIFNERFYVLFIIAHKTREIVQFAITKNPVKEFVKQQLIDFSEFVKGSVYLIHDRDSGFMFIDYLHYGINSVATSFKAPNMNSIAERFIRSIREEALDNFILLNQKQISKIITEYVEYYNSERPHQGINSIPRGKPPDLSACSHRLNGNVCSKSVLGGLHHHYFYRKSA